MGELDRPGVAAARALSGAARNEPDNGECTCWLCPECGAISDTRWHMEQHVDRRGGDYEASPSPHCFGGGTRGENAIELHATRLGAADA